MIEGDKTGIVVFLLQSFFGIDRLVAAFYQMHTAYGMVNDSSFLSFSAGMRERQAYVTLLLWRGQLTRGE